jgi:hypothetical protein
LLDTPPVCEKDRQAVHGPGVTRSGSDSQTFGSTSAVSIFLADFRKNH